MSNESNSKFVEAVRYIHSHIDEPLELESVASSIGVSLSSLKRIFETVCEKSPGAFIRTLRLESAFKSLKSKEDSVLETALAAGFQDHAAFSRAFKDAFSYSPSSARSKVNIVQELESVTLADPEIVEILPTEIQSVTLQGTYFECAPKAWEALKEKMNPVELSDDFSGLFVGIGHDNPHDGEVMENEVRFTAGVGMLGRNLGLSPMVIPGGRYARFRYLGRLANLGMAYHYIFGRWLSTSGFTIKQGLNTFILCDGLPEMGRDHTVMINVPIV